MIVPRWVIQPPPPFSPFSGTPPPSPPMPLIRFEPIFRHYLWGGHRLRKELGKPAGDQPCAESWEIVDHGRDQSRVADGPWKGRTLGELVRDQGPDLVGEALSRELFRDDRPQSLRGRFPLLFKFLDAHRDLSVQVHPDDAMAARLSPPDLGKTEAWHVLATTPGARIYAGLKKGVTPPDWTAAVASGEVETLLHSFEPQVGDTVFVEAGTVHALGKGLLIAEIQQASDTTFRLFDWNRVDAAGNARELHLSQGLAATRYEIGPVEPIRWGANRGAGEGSERIRCDAFVLHVHQRVNRLSVGGDGRFRIVAATRGRWEYAGDPGGVLARGDTALLPASAPAVELSSREPAELLEIHVP